MEDTLKLGKLHTNSLLVGEKDLFSTLGYNKAIFIFIKHSRNACESKQVEKWRHFFLTLATQPTTWSQRRCALSYD